MYNIVLIIKSKIHIHTRRPGYNGYGYGRGWINPTRTRTLLYPAAVPGRVQQPVTIPRTRWWWWRPDGGRGSHQRVIETRWWWWGADRSRTYETAQTTRLRRLGPVLSVKWRKN